MSFDVNPLDDNPDPHGECRREIERLQGFETAYRIWQEKTDWIQHENWSFPALGMHRADVARREIERLREQLKLARSALESIVETQGIDKGVVYLSSDSPTRPSYDVETGQPCRVYVHRYFSPLGDALINLHELLKD